MRDQYAGDISDAFKFAFLRALAADDRKLGIAWYYDPGHDGRADGKHIEWSGEEAWRQLDQELHAGLASLPARSVAALEQAQIWPRGTLFHREPVPLLPHRSGWSARKRSALSEADIVFLDPDNGLGKATEKNATYDEVRLLRRMGRAIVFITFPPRVKHELLLGHMHERLVEEAGAEDVLTLRTCASVPILCKDGLRRAVPRTRWFTIVDADAELIVRAKAFARTLKAMPGISRAELVGARSTGANGRKTCLPDGEAPRA